MTPAAHTTPCTHPCPTRGLYSGSPVGAACPICAHKLCCPSGPPCHGCWGLGGCPATLWLDVLGSGSPVHGGEKMLIGGDGRTERQEGSRRRTRFSHQTEVHRGGPCPQHWAPGCSRGTEGSQRKVAPEWEGSRRTGLGSPEEEGNPAPALGRGFPSITERPPPPPNPRQQGASRSWKTGRVQ